MDAEYAAEMVPVSPDSTAKPMNCYINVERKIAATGTGKIVYGWIIWENDLIMEAIHHAVWETDQAELICLTPHKWNFNRIVFVPDDRVPYLGENIDSVRMNVTANPLVDTFIRLVEIREAVLRTGKRTDDSTLTLHPYAREFQQILNDEAGNLLQFIINGGKLASRCFCNSGGTYSRCHGKNVVVTAEKMYRNLIAELSAGREPYVKQGGSWVNTQ